MKVSFYGAAGMVTGSCYLLETETARIILDCGLFQGQSIAEQNNFEPFPFEPETIDAVLVTHAHLDHTGRIPKLVKEGFQGKVIATAPTIRLMDLLLEDSVHILASTAAEHDQDPLYDTDHVTKTRTLYSEAEYHASIQVKGVTVEFFDAGHILGSSIIRITNEAGERIVFSGDLGNPPVPMLNRTEAIHEAEYVIMESTYGGRVHEDKHDRTLLLQSAIYETVTMGGVLMVPAFAMERTQELLYELNEMVNNKDIPSVPVFLDSPLAIRATRVFKEFEEYFNNETQSIIQSGDDVFHFPGLKMTLSTEESKRINSAPVPKVIIAGSGMAQGGRIQHHIKRYISDPNSQYLIVGYQVHGSLGRAILDGAKEIHLQGETIPVKAKVRAIGGYSAHADQPALTAWLSNFDKTKLKKVFLTHGENDQAEALKRHFQQRMEVDIAIPALNDSVELL